MIRQGRENQETTDLPVSRKINIRLIPLAAIISLLVSCSEGEEYYRYHHLSKGQWYRDSAVVFTIDSLPLNPEKRYAVTLEITSSDRYPYRDLWLRVDHNLTDTLFHSDTLHTLLADEHGRWLGSGVGGLNQLSLPYLSTLSPDTARRYRLVIRQVMSDHTLTGIERVGLKVTETDGDKSRHPSTTSSL